MLDFLAEGSKSAIPAEPLGSNPLDVPDMRLSHNHVETVSYPGRDTSPSGRLFTVLYEEEEFYERMETEERRLAETDADDGGLNNSQSQYRTVYHILRLFDSLRGFHKGELDLNGRHPERYHLLHAQWNTFLCDFLSFEAEIQSCEELHFLGVPNNYIVLDAQRWYRFQSDWRLPNTVSYCQLLKRTRRVLYDLIQQPVPQFQALKLTLLPSEILNHIFTFLPIPLAKNLSQTCNHLYDIGHRHIFRTWKARLQAPSSLGLVKACYSSADDPLLAEYARSNLLKNFQYLLTSPRILNQVTKVIFSDEWWLHRKAHFLDTNQAATLSPEFYRSLLQGLSTVLKTTPKLTHLTLCNIELNYEFTRTLTSLSSLHTFELHLCRVSKLVRRRLLNHSTPPVSPIANLRFSIDSGFNETHTQWAILLLCPGVRTLTITQFGLGPFVVPDPAIWQRTYLPSLERLSLDNVDVPTLELFLSSYTSGLRTSPSQLRYFKIHTEWGINDTDALSLLSAIPQAPLEVLVLEGLSEAHFPLLDHTADHYPALIALTLVRRHQNNQHQNKFAAWPRPSWEYAERFGRFGALRYFCWNFMMHYWDATPSLLVAFENDFWSGQVQYDHQHQHHQLQATSSVTNGSANPNPIQNPTSSSSSSSSSTPGRCLRRSCATRDLRSRRSAQEEEWHRHNHHHQQGTTSTPVTTTNRLSSSSTHDDHSAAGNMDIGATTSTEDLPYFLDTHWMAMPFAAYCPTLETFCLMDCDIDMACHITRHVSVSDSGGGDLEARSWSLPSSSSSPSSTLASALTSGGGGGSTGGVGTGDSGLVGGRKSWNSFSLAPQYFPLASYHSCGVHRWNTVGSHWPILLPLHSR